MMTKILIVDDDDDIRKSLKRILTRNGYDAIQATNGFDAIEVISQSSPQLVLLDIMMPEMNGFATCERIRASNPSIGIIFLSAKGDPIDKATGLRIGGDDYISKPFDIDELLARIQAVLRRTSTSRDKTPTIIHLDDLTITPSCYSVTRAGQQIELSAREFEIVAYLAAHPGQVFSRNKIHQCVWGSDCLGDDKSVAVYIRKIREKIENDPQKPLHLVTVWGVGYKLV